jgi:hypothetical protein
MRRFILLIGPHEFDGLKCDLDQALPAREPEFETGRSTETKTEDGDVARLVVKTFLGLIVVALAVAGGLGIATSDWGPMQAVWLILAAPLEALFDRYIG